MNRRQFLGASLAGIIVALSLPFERFAEWCRSWLGAVGLERVDSYEYRLISYPQFFVSAVDHVRGVITLDSDETLIMGADAYRFTPGDRITVNA